MDQPPHLSLLFWVFRHKHIHDTIKTSAPQGKHTFLYQIGSPAPWRKGTSPRIVFHANIFNLVDLKVQAGSILKRKQHLSIHGNQFT